MKNSTRSSKSILTLVGALLTKILLRPIYGLIFLFKWVAQPNKPETLSEYDPELFFAN